jgi:tRNA pseudouridine55 synthase
MPASSIHGLLVLDKPGGITSRCAVDRATGWFPRRTKIGHTGTLDPLATGVLVLCIGTATRLTEYVQEMTKTYRTELLLGVGSDTDDVDGIVTPAPAAVIPDRSILESTLPRFQGLIEQIPPSYSAAKITGMRAHELARRGKEFELQPRSVRIDSIKTIKFDYPALELEVRCGKGTYIRSMARDLGRALGCGAVVKTLRRTQVGPFHADDSLSLEADARMARSRLLPIDAAVSELPKIVVANQQAERLRHGLGIPWGADLPSTDSAIAVLNESKSLIAVVRFDAGDKLLWPEKVVGG